MLIQSKTVEVCNRSIRNKVFFKKIKVTIQNTRKSKIGGKVDDEGNDSHWIKGFVKM